MLVLIDNYDSFTYNLVQYFGDLGENAQVYRNDKIKAEDVFALKPDAIVLSPGPGTPDDAGICLDVIRLASEHSVPLLGICLGHQSIGQVFGGKVIRAPKPCHGKVSEVHHEGVGLFENIPEPLTVTRYHSLVVERENLPFCLEVTGETDDGLIMAISHKNKPIYGVQFHPESIATESGHSLLKNFLNLVKE